MVMTINRQLLNCPIFTIGTMTKKFLKHLKIHSKAVLVLVDRDTNKDGVSDSERDGKYQL